jgi:hypothetical protein
MHITLQPQVLIRFDSAIARRLATLLLTVVRSALVAVFVFYAKFHPLASLLGMRYESGWFLLGIGALLNVPLYALFQLLPDLRTFTSSGLPFPHTVVPPTWRFLVIAVPLYVLLSLAWRPMARLALRLSAIVDALEVRLPSRFLRNNAPFLLRAFICCAVFSTIVRYGFTPQFYAVGDAHNFLLEQQGVARLFLYLSLAPGLPLRWLLGHRGAIELGSLYPSLGFLIVNAFLIALLATGVRFVLLRANSSDGSQFKDP